MDKRTFKALYGQYRKCRRNLLADGAMETAHTLTRVLRDATGRFANFPEAYRTVPKMVRTSDGTVIYRLAGPWLSGRRGALRS